MATAENIDVTFEANGIASDLVRVIYHNNLAALKSTLDRFHVPDRCYSLLKLRDESTCLTNEEGLWKVFYSERGLKTNTKISTDIEEACMMILYEMAESHEEYENMQYYYNMEMDNLSSVKTSSKDIFEVLRESLRKMSTVAAAL